MPAKPTNTDDTTDVPEKIVGILSLIGATPEYKTIQEKWWVAYKNRGWRGYSFRRGNDKDSLVPIFLFEHDVKTARETRDVTSEISNCIAIFHLKSEYSIFFKSGGESTLFKLDSDDAYEHILAALNLADYASASTRMEMRIRIKRTINNIPTTTQNFNNKGVFSTHYLKNRLFTDMDINVDDFRDVWEGNAKKSLACLGWTSLEGENGVYRSSTTRAVSIVVADHGQDFGVRRNAGDVAPSYRAVAELRNTPWVMLTNGTVWRLYTTRVSASTTNYFEINLAVQKEIILRYLAVMFGAASYLVQKGKTGIDTIFDEGKNYVQELEDNLADRILRPDGVFVDMVKGVLGHDMRKQFGAGELATAKEIALKIMYRVWFLLYAESRDLLPVRDEKYKPLSLMSLRNRLDHMDDNPDGTKCWDDVLGLFDGVRNGSPEHNLPQYNGELFKHLPEIDGIRMKNRFFVRALRGLIEKDGEPMDYASLGVRHLGYIYETLMEFAVRQAEKDIMLLEDKDGVREVESKAESTYSYKKNDLYIISKKGSMSRKSSGTYYTPEKIVEFLVMRGLEPIFKEREELIADDLKKYKRDQSSENYRGCMDRLLDIQVLDPSMGSGHFLVEALNRITQWATGILERHPEHPLLREIEDDRRLIISTQKEGGVVINPGLLTHDVLLKRRIMKRCIFGVDVNPLAVELARVSLWLDSFAIGVPLTYVNHHIKVGDSTIGAWRRDVEDARNQSLDDYVETTNRAGEIIARVSNSADVTIDQVHSSEDAHNEYEKAMNSYKIGLDVYSATQIDGTVIPKKASKNPAGYIHRFIGQKANDGDMRQTLTRTQELRKKYLFFHWELEMMDAFTDSRYGFDLVVGNPPWDKVKPYDDEFFSQYYPAFKSLNTKTKKTAKINKLLRDPKIKTGYEEYLLSFKEKSAFYRTYDLQGKGDRDLWQLVFERMLGLVGKGGIVSVLIPSQILANDGSTEMRKRILDLDIQQLYVFENRKKIFPIDSRYRFLLLSVRNRPGLDTFQAGFYLHHLSSLETDETEREKFYAMSKQTIRKTSPDTLQIPEVEDSEFDILNSLSSNESLTSESDDGWEVAFSRGFDKTNDVHLLKESGVGWPVLEGGNIHQFNHDFAKPMFTADISTGLRREENSRVYKNSCRNFYHSFRLAFRDISSSTNMRSIIASIIPPQRFFTCSLRVIVLTRNGNFEHGNEYNKKTAYLCGILNSMTFDFVARSKLQMHTMVVIKALPIPDRTHHDDIATLAAKLSVGSDEFEGFAESMRVENMPLTPYERIHATARLDALVAHAYHLSKEEYKTILKSFKFEENPALLEADTADFNDNKTLRAFYGEVRKLAPGYYDSLKENEPK